MAIRVDVHESTFVILLAKLELSQAKNMLTDTLPVQHPYIHKRDDLLRLTK